MIYSADGSVAYNPTNTELFIKTAAGVSSLLPGETKKIL